MTKDEAMQILAILKGAYPNSYRGVTEKEAHLTATVWAAQFANMPADVVLIAVNKLISKNTFPPSINEVKDKIRGLYWEAWHITHEYEQTPKVKEKFGVEARSRYSEEIYYKAKRIVEIIEPTRSRGTSEPTLEDLLKGFSGYLSGGDNKPQIE